MSAQRDIARLLGRIESLERQLRDVSMTPQLAASSVVDGAIDQVQTVEVGVDENGNSIFEEQVVSRWGQQEDGTNGVVVLDGPEPPSPTAPTVEAIPAALRITWDGLFEEGQTAPLDFAGVAVHVGLIDEGEVVPSPDTLRATMVSTAGEEVVVAVPDSGDDYTICLVTVTTAGVWSEPSYPVDGQPGDGSTLPVVRDLVTLFDGKAGVTYSSLDPDPTIGAVGDMWFKHDADDKTKVVGCWVKDDAGWQPAEFTDEVIGSLTAGKITTGTLVAGVSISSVAADGSIVRMGDGAYTVQHPDMDGALQQTVVLGGLDRDVLMISDPDTGEVISGFDGLGGTITQSLSAETITLGGQQLGGGSRDDLLFPYPLGVSEGQFRPLVDSAAAGQTPLGICEVSRTVYPYRRYRVHFEGNFVCSTAGAFRLFLYVTTDGSAPTVGLKQIDMGWFAAPVAGLPFRAAISKDVYVGGADEFDAKTLRVLLAAQKYSDGTVRYFSDGGATPGMFAVEDVGYHNGVAAELYDDGQMSGGGGTASGGTAPTPPPVVARKTTTATWTASWSRTWGNAETGEMRQSDAHRSALGFPAAMSTAISGATISKIEVYVWAHHWYSNSGGTLIVGAHGSASAPASFPGGSATTTKRWDTKTGARWITLPSAWYRFWSSGSSRGITIGDGVGASNAYYGRFDGVGGGYKHPPLIRITYTK